MRHTGNIRLAFHVVLLCSAMAASAAWAQETPQTDESDAAADASGDIIVTARFRQERLQDTPLSVSAFNANAI